ncbi:MAG: rhomboid family intramembrane serine protease [Saprospiraceae bacterium]|nr:rhomboid family intramembrane serine protease [Saprospiraceae bacterium]
MSESESTPWLGPFRQPIFTALRIVALLWVLHLLRIFHILPYAPTDWGLYPRRMFGLTGILTAPLAHSDWKHLISNSIPLLAMIVVIWTFFRRVSWQAFLMIYFLTGVAVWLFARSVFHVGASGVVYGLVSFVFWSGVFRRSVKSIVLSLIVIMIYTPMFAGILPNQEGISWESHLLGGVVGILVAWWYKRDLEPEEIEEPKEQDPKSRFLDPGTFDMTRKERRRQQLFDEQQEQEGYSA